MVIHYDTFVEYRNEILVWIDAGNLIIENLKKNLKHHLVAHPHIFIKNRINLKTNTLKNIFEQQNLDIFKYNFINIDIQGAELIALDGAADLINNIHYIYAEVNEKELYEDCATIEFFDLFLKQKGFKRVKTEMTTYGWGHALYIKETLL